MEECKKSWTIAGDMITHVSGSQVFVGHVAGQKYGIFSLAAGDTMVNRKDMNFAHRSYTDCLYYLENTIWPQYNNE